METMRRVSPDIAKTGECIETFDIDDWDTLQSYGKRMERELKKQKRSRDLLTRQRASRELVYTRIHVMPGEHNDTWQIFLLP